MRDLVAALCSDACAGRATGTEGGRRARGLVVGAFREAGLDPDEQAIPRCNGTNVLARIPGDVDRWVLVAAHYDHLGTLLGEVYRGADDNAAAVAILVELAHSLAVRPPTGRGVILAAFDAEEPPHFLTSLESLGALAEALAPASPEAAGLLPVLHRLRGQVRRDRSLPDSDHAALLMLLASVERLLG